MLLLALEGCSRWTGQLPMVSVDTGREGIKMLRPDAEQSVCRVGLLGSAPDASLVDRAMRQLLALDGEADALLDVRVSGTTMWLGFIDRTCIVVHADVVRRTSVVRLPAPASHEGHH